MKDSDTSSWVSGLKIVQMSKNCSYHSEIKRTPCEALFGKSAIETSSKHYKRGLQEQAEKMLKASGKMFPPAVTGDNILVCIPDVDRGRLAP
ncbi:hypothetical protein PR048_029681 [Dryococelus australis]|uniref:Uncharacterized protein n=1 Tax=Dryococelus australis TaxID=614101 RepID=A0ABQ9GG25_9NEOP|nr:hypothetical protein PR048_029681 [Dryococelus australis]